MSDDGEILLTVNDRQLQGWTSSQVTRGIERCPNDFQLTLTADNPLLLGPDVVQPGDSFVLSVDADVIVTGRVNRVRRRNGPDDHRLTVVGRGNCQDLVDCSAEWPGGQIKNADAFQIAQKLAGAYGISVTLNGPPGKAVPQFNITVGTTAWQIIETVCRWANLLAYEGADGNLILSQAGTAVHASGFTAGWNLTEWDADDRDDQCFSQYDAFRLGMDLLGDLGSGGNLIGSAKDPNVKRHRRRFIVAEAGAAGQDVAQARANWEAARNRGRAASVTVVADSWRDQSGAVWTPNMQAPVTLPGRYDKTLLTLSEVMLGRDEGQGTYARVTLMDKAAFTPEPVLLLPAIPDFNPPA